MTPSPFSGELQDALDRLIAAVDIDNRDVDEYDTLARLMVSAGLMWRCWDSDCAGINHMHCAKCDNCGKRRPKEREVPMPDYMTRLSLDYDRQQRRAKRLQQEAEGKEKDIQQAAEATTNTEENRNEMDH